jgi:hypothetical protein
MWRDVSGICELKVFEDLDTNFIKRNAIWKKWVQTSAENPEADPAATAAMEAAIAAATAAGNVAE